MSRPSDGRVSLMTLALWKEGRGSDTVHSMLLRAEPSNLEDRIQCIRAVRRVLSALMCEGTAREEGWLLPAPEEPLTLAADLPDVPASPGG